MKKLKHEQRAIGDKVRRNGTEFDDESEIGSLADQKRWREENPERKKTSDLTPLESRDPNIKQVSKIVIDLTKPLKHYSINDRYELLDRIKHPEFGKGIVTYIEDDTKIQVKFRHSTKILMMNKKAA